MLAEFETKSRKLGYTQIRLDVRETQDAAIGLYEGAGYICWSVKDRYARVKNKYIKGFFYTKDLTL